MARYHKIEGKRVKLTDAEETARDAEEKAWADGAFDRAIVELRQKRNALLASSDWTGLSDSALTSEVSAKWKLYRQKLRDLPSGLDTEEKVKNVTWPAKPE
jgi:hypothetical protein